MNLVVAAARLAEGVCVCVFVSVRMLTEITCKERHCMARRTRL